MKIRRGYEGGKQVSLIKALTETINGDDDRGGAVERATQTAEGAAEMVAMLVTILARKGVLSKDDIRPLLHVTFVITDD